MLALVSVSLLSETLNCLYSLLEIILLPFAGHCALLCLCLTLLLRFVLPLVSNSQQDQGIGDQFLLDVLVEWSVSGKAWRVVDLLFISNTSSKTGTRLQSSMTSRPSISKHISLA